MVSSRSKWEEFFKQAGVPSKPSTEYAIIFSDNRMRLDMLDELNKELLNDLGVKAMGDVIAILRHAKLKHNQMSRQRSSSPEIIEPHASLTTEKPKQTVKNTPAKISTNTPPTTEPKPISTKGESTKNLSTVKRSIPSDSTSKNANNATSKSKPRKTLSSRFIEYEQETKRKKQETDKPEETKQLSGQTSATAKMKTKGTVFTIQVPSKPPSNMVVPTSATSVKTATLKSKARTSASPGGSVKNELTENANSMGTSKTMTNRNPAVHKSLPLNRAGSVGKITTSSIKVSNSSKTSSPKVTLVPALGKQLNRNKKSTSIFDRLDNSNGVPRETVKVGPTNQDKSDVFRRLGSREKSVTPPVSKSTSKGTNDADISTTNVFKRLGDR